MSGMYIGCDIGHDPVSWNMMSDDGLKCWECGSRKGESAYMVWNRHGCVFIPPVPSWGLSTATVDTLI